MNIDCPHCQQTLACDESLAGTSVECPACGKSIDIPIAPKIRIVKSNETESASEERASENATSDAAERAKAAAAKVGETFAKAVGVEKLEGFSLKSLFSEAFKEHPEEEVERSFMCGTPETTPSIGAVDASWPRPWIFMRALIAAIAIYWALHSYFGKTENVYLLPAMMVVGSFAVPISALMFFIESNVRRNISVYQVFRLFLCGGVTGVVWASMTWYVFNVFNGVDNPYATAILAGLIEEPVKLAALWRCKSLLRHRYVLNGLLIGAALGAGFAALESTGYAFSTLLENGETSEMELNILLRGVLAPLAHIIWTAIVCAALWRVKGDSPFRFGMLVDRRFLRLAALPVILHILWDLPGHTIPVIDVFFVLRYLILGVVGWVAVLCLLQEGLKEIRKEKEAATATAAEPRRPDMENETQRG